MLPSETGALTQLGYLIARCHEFTAIFMNLLLNLLLV